MVDPVKIEQVKEVVANYYDIKVSQMLSRSRLTHFREPRQIMAYLLNYEAVCGRMSLSATGKAIGYFNHATILHSCKAVKNMLATDRNFAARYEKLKEKVTQALKDMLTVDVIIPSNALTYDLQRMTQRAITSCHASSTRIHFRIWVMEQQPGVVYANAETIHYKFDFNYNACLNAGSLLGRSEWLLWANSDVIFEAHFFDHIHSSYKSTGIPSWGCRNPGWEKHSTVTGDVIEGYDIGVHLTGWVIACRRETWQRIGLLRTDARFWYCDLIYADQLRSIGAQHALCNNALVTHIPSRTLAVIPKAERELLTKDNEYEYQVFRRRHVRNAGRH